MKKYDIICIQEHSLWESQYHELSSLVRNKDTFVRSSDYSVPISGFNLPRGRDLMA